MSTRQNSYSVDAVLNRVEYSGDDISSESEDNDDFTATVTSASDSTDSSNFSVEETEGHPTQACLLFIIFITKL